jgi:beta-N-acetylhexosaminidase
MTDPADFLRQAPFNLDADAIAWVTRTAASLTGDARLMQLFVLGLHGPAEHWADGKIKTLQPGGVMRFFSADGAAEANLLDHLQDGADIPYLVSADLEGSRMSLAFTPPCPIRWPSPPSMTSP